uniref:Uncharacterized protein n=1 Tax=Glossina palpalis gambiensis TaxID=67801 RepID=A0A1B0AP09_9MUSC
MGANKSSPQTVPIDLAQLYVSPSVSVEILRDSLSEALQRTENTNIEIQKLRNQLIACHRDHLGEPLCCAELVERFQDLVFREQYLNKLEVKLKIDESSE